ncbi:hypothetical protein HYH02_001478 [Chlamydomonas schloesseri]|uniref:Uncharacterized protein n=1 Tax=Chlamydomonas schloesseri TaxID=2026947 RepID=A0A835WW11_9CHLO|nr:hypothetical protein HYH02_001478 [Chlamydomonas schloesseri]|eukprot:KAG2454459.1 hypothetical protein HYH02_001478 [Chlamydomonas schloesseri]
MPSDRGAAIITKATHDDKKFIIIDEGKDGFHQEHLAAHGYLEISGDWNERKLNIVVRNNDTIGLHIKVPSPVVIGPLSAARQSGPQVPSPVIIGPLSAARQSGAPDMPATLLVLDETIHTMDDDFSEITVTNGFKASVGAAMDVDPGVTATMNVEIRAKVVTETSFETLKEAIKENLNQEEVNHLNENHTGYGAAAGWLAGAFGIAFGVGGYNHNKNQERKYDANSSKFTKRMASTVKNLAESEVVIKGTATVTNNLPRRVSARFYIEFTSVKFGNKVSYFASTNGTAANEKTKEPLDTKEKKINILNEM